LSRLRTILALLLAAIILAAGWGSWRTAATPDERPAAHAAATGAPPLVDRRALDRARRLLPRATTEAEHPAVLAALGAADHLLDLSFAAALREATDHPPPVTPAIAAAQQRLDRAASQLVADNLEIQRLAALPARGNREHDDATEASLAFARAQFEVDQYEFDQAGKGLIDAGGDLRGRIQALVAEHDASAAKPVLPAVEAPVRAGLVRLLGRALTLWRKTRALEAARDATNAALAELDVERTTVSERIRAQAGTHGEAAEALRASTERIAADQAARRLLDERRAGELELSRAYDRWLAVVAEQQAALWHRILRGILVMAGACLLLLFIGSWLGMAFGRLRIDRRQVETLKTVTTVALQVAAVFVILLVIVGPPSQLGTILGLAGAGLTVALRDFIVAFIGWLSLMGRNGIRIGDWVEINGVTGEVVELGMFHTVLLETGNWTDSGHPTGRRVTFTNSFAIQGYFFNFSTSGQWLWDELQLVVPAGRDLYALVAAISHKVEEATADNARLAEEEWRRAAPTRALSGLSVAPAIRVKPVLGGTEIALRYIARAGERHALRARLYEAAVALLATPADGASAG
jgi:small-conductance mechanosensitive channel